jgi:triosephosphate isomerase
VNATHSESRASFNQAMQFLYAKHGNAISEDLVQNYCKQGLLREDEAGKLVLTDQGRAHLRWHRTQPVN